jgi:hypothetical protein
MERELRPLRMLEWTITRLANVRSREPFQLLLVAYFVEKLADTISGDIFGGRLTTTRCAIVDPGPF